MSLIYTDFWKFAIAPLGIKIAFREFSENSWMCKMQLSHLKRCAGSQQA